MRVLIFRMYDQSLFFPFNNGALTRSGTNQHDDSLTYCDALFIFLSAADYKLPVDNHHTKMCLDYKR